MYSLILSDEIVDRIDILAKLQNKSRSGLINEILAQYASIETPEQQISDLYSLMSESMERFSNEFRFMVGERRSDFTAISALKYKYNPTIRYNVILYRENAHHIGELRATLRTQNARLLSEYSGFIEVWNKIELLINGRESRSSLKSGSYRRLLERPQGNVTSEGLSSAIANYITLFNSSMKIYLSAEGDISSAGQSISSLYIEYYKGGIVL